MPEDNQHATNTNQAGPIVLPLTGARGYAVAAFFVAGALALRVALDPVWGDRLPFATFFLAELILVQVVDSGPFLLAMFAGFILADWFFINPRHSLLISDLVNQINGIFYFLASSTLLFFAARARRNATARKIAEAKLERLAAIVESSDDAIIAKTLDGTILSWNAGATRLYGYSAVEAIGKSISMLMPPEKAAELSPILERVRRGEQIDHFESIRRTRDGRTIPVSLSISPVRDERGGIIAAATIARDISERKQAEQERERLLRELQEALANVKTLSGLLPICANCKKIRDEKGSWNQIEVYIRQRSGANFTHSICPECLQNLYPDLASESDPSL